MLMTIFAAVVFIGLLFSAMAVGVILSNKPIKGSCGGMAALGMKQGCDICGGEPDKCDDNARQVDQEKAASLGKDVMKI